MSYQLDPDFQVYGDKNYLAHNLKGATPGDDRRLFAERISAFGIIDFGSMSANSVKSYTPATDGVLSPIMIASIFAFTTSATSDEVNFKIFDGNTEILEQKISNSEMPYKFPPGAIIRPDLTIQVKPRYNTKRLLIYWQPVHILHNAQL